MLEKIVAPPQRWLEAKILLQRQSLAGQWLAFWNAIRTLFLGQ